MNNHLLQRPTHAKSETHRYNWLMAFSHELLHINALVEVAWLKAHVGFMGNEIADALAKGSTSAAPPKPNLTPPLKAAYPSMAFHSQTS